MDYLDPRKQAQHTMLLMVGYVCIAIAIIFATIVLVYSAYGFGLAKNGTVIQNGLVFFSSQPNPAHISIDGKPAKIQTNTRDTLPAGAYKIKMSRTGYDDWQRTIEISGSQVVHFDYPLLLPTKPQTTKLADIVTTPTITTQSPDRRWLLLDQPNNPDTFTVYDLRDVTKPPLSITLPDTIVTKATTNESWQMPEWADDNQHVLMQHIVDGKTEFILLDRQNPDQSVNLSQTLNTSPTSISLDNKKYDQYYIYNSVDQTLQTASLKSPTPEPLLSSVLAYKDYGSNELLYVTTTDAPSGKVWLRLRTSATQTTDLRTFPSGTQYIVDLATYSGTPYIVAGAVNENKVYIYKDPLSQLANQPSQAIVPVQVLQVQQPGFESFSSTAQFIIAENGSQIAVYDIENDLGYNYMLKTPLTAPQTHVVWMDGDRLTYVSNGQLQIMDYDSKNLRSFVPATAIDLPFFTPNYKSVITLAPQSDSSATGLALTNTSLLTANDQ